MRYTVTTSLTNGYRCGCCSRSYDSEEQCETLEEALRFVPLDLTDSLLPFNDNCEVESVTVVEDATGEEVAMASLTWPTSYGKVNLNAYSCWRGFHPDHGAFETIYRGRTRTDETKEECDLMLAVEHHQKEIRDAQKKMAEAQATLAEAQKSLAKLDRN